MKIGITYDLRDDYLKQGYSLEETAEFDREDTIAGIEEALIRSGFETERIGTIKELTGRLAAGQRWDLVFNIAEGISGIGREAQVPALLDAYNIPYTFSDPLVLALTLDKAITKTIIRQGGIATADFAVVKKISDIDDICLPYPLFAKPIGEGTGKGISEASKITSEQDLATVCLHLLQRFGQPALVETYLPGREFTAGIVGTDGNAEVIGVMEVLFKNSHRGDTIYSYDNKANYEEIIDYRIPEAEIIEKCSHLALASWNILGCRDGGRIDIRMDSEGRPNFIEVNPLAGLNPIHSDLPIMCRLQNIPYQKLIESIVHSAMKRMTEEKR
jgi:D-alanine-D-alanine ligase